MTSASSAAELFADLPAIETPRLVLRKMRLADAADMFEYASDPGMTEYTVWDHHRSIGDAEAFLRCVLDNYARGGIENWGMELRDDGRFIGTCGYFLWSREHRLGEIQYAIGREHWGRGLMTEAAAAAVRFGFERMGLHRVQAKCIVGNTGSERVMQKLGMQFEGIIRDGVLAKGKFHDLKMYAVLKHEFQGL